ncbi:hypothetical protein GQ53DRAFT_715081 [Thozetella sp. PMI_491]|nr:hypothetical protein GQ53DRAFT_715081 [Thozetella sp. PMI_491]
MAALEPQEQRASRACLECRNSKTRCIWLADMGVGKCKRCSRSKRPCTFSESSTARRQQTSRVNKLEEKIDGLVSLLHASRQIPGQALLQTPYPSALSVQPLASLNDAAAAPSDIPNHVVQPDPSASEREARFHTSLVPDSVEIIPDFMITFSEANRLLDLYRTSLSPNFPFLPVPQTTTAQGLYAMQPLLFKVIMHVVAPQTRRIQLDFDRWFHCHIAQQVTNLLHLAIGQVIDLGLDQPPRLLPVSAVMATDEMRARLPPPPVQTLAHKRAMLGCYFICASISNLFRKMVRFPYTVYHTTCCNDLSDATEYASDQLLVALVQIQRIAGRISATFLPPELGGDAVEFSGSSYMVISTIANELHSLKEALPREVQDDDIFVLNYRGTLLRVYEPAVHARGSSASGDWTNPGHRTEALWACLEASKTLFEAFQAVSLDKFAYLPFPGVGYLSFSVMTSASLLFLNDAEWDVHVARKSLDFANLLGQIGLRYDELDRLEASEEMSRKRKYWGENITLSMRYCVKMRMSQSWYLSKTAPTPETSIESSEAGTDMLRQLDFMPLDSSDPAFWEVMMSEDLGAFHYLVE